MGTTIVDVGYILRPTVYEVPHFSGCFPRRRASDWSWMPAAALGDDALDFFGVLGF